MRQYRNLLTLVAFVVFSTALGGTFHFDDYSLFADPAVLAPSGWTAAFRLTTTRPLSWLTFWLNYQVAGQSPLLWHLFDLAIHVACVALLYSCLERLISPRAALIGASLFAIHPVQAETVNYVFARPTSLATLLCLASLLSWLKDARWQAVAWFALALTAKEECVFFPLFLALLQVADKKLRPALTPLAAMLALAALAGARVLFATGVVAGAGAGFASTVTPLDYLLAQGFVILRYIAELFWPPLVNFDPDLHPPALFGVLGWLTLLAFAAWTARRLDRTKPAFWCLAALVLLLASSSIFPADDLAADRRLYLPFVALAAAAGLLLERTPRWLPAAIGVFFVAFAIQRTATWNTELSLWTDTVAKSPLKVRPRLQLARAQQPDDALRTLDVATKNNPNDPAVASELGKVHLQMRHPDQALGAFGRAAALAPRDAQSWNNLGVAFASLGQAQAAEAQFRHAIALDPCLADARRNLGLVPCSGPRP